MARVWRLILEAVGAMAFLGISVAAAQEIRERNPAVVAEKNDESEATRRATWPVTLATAEAESRANCGTPKECRAEQRDYANLRAQRDAADAAKAQEATARSQTRIALAGAALLLITLMAQVCATAAVVQEVRILRSAQIPDLVVGNISYLRKSGPDRAEFLKRPTTDDYLQVRFRNRNQSLLYIAPSRYGYIVSDTLPAKPQYDREVQFPVEADPLPGQPVEFALGLSLAEDDINKIRDGAKLWVWIKLEFKDVFRRRHVIGIAAEWLPRDDQTPTSPQWGNSFKAVFDPAYHYQKS